MSILENEKYALMICEMFYTQNMTQKEIAEELNISRPQICRILANAREQGLVNIQITYPVPEEGELENRIRELYGLSEVYVYNIGADDNPIALNLLAQRASDLFRIYLRDNSRVGVMSGRSVEALVKAFPVLRLRNTEFVPLSGGINSNGCEWFANSNARICAEKTHSNYYILHAPAVLSSQQAKEILVQEESIKRIVDLWSQCDTVLIGIGTAGISASSSVAGLFSEEDIAELRNLGAVSSVCSSYFDKGGHEIHHSISERFIGASISDIAKAKKIAVAIGAEKAAAIKAALTGDCVDVLITSLETAKLLVDE